MLGIFFFDAQTVVGNITHLIVDKVEYRNRLSQPALFRAVSLVEQGGVTTIGTHRDRRRVAVSASNKAGYRNSEGLARRKIDLMRALVCARDHQQQARKGKRSQSED